MTSIKEQPEFLKYFKRATKKQMQEIENDIDKITREDVLFHCRPKVLKQYTTELNSILDNIFFTVSSQTGGADKHIEDLESHLCSLQGILESLYPSTIAQQKCTIYTLWHIHKHRKSHGDLFKLVPYIATIRIGSHKITAVAYELFINIPDEVNEPRHIISYIDDDTWYIVEEFNRVLAGEASCPMLFTNRLEDTFNSL
jgi:hypothetical protein